MFQSNPTEMLTTADGWVPAGDDYNAGDGGDDAPVRLAGPADGDCQRGRHHEEAAYGGAGAPAVRW